MSPHQRVLVTGATGFVGGALARRLVAGGHDIRCLVRASSDVSGLRDLPGDGAIEFVTGDLRDRESLRNAVEGCDAVVHSAAMVSDWGTVEEIRSANVAGSADLAAAACEAGARRFVQISTTDVYGYPGTAALTEAFVPDGFANWYSQTKRDAEAAVREIADGAGMDLVVLRPATVYGPGSSEVVGEMTRAMRGRYLPSIAGGRAIAGLVHVENLVDAILLALTHREAAGQAFNLVDGLDVTWQRFLGDIGSRLGYRRPWIKLSYRVAFGLAVVLEESYRALRRLTGLRTAPLLSRAAVQILGIDQAFSADKVRRVLGWEPAIGYEEGLTATVAWLREDFLPAH